jgi:hypothetical protein
MAIAIGAHPKAQLDRSIGARQHRSASWREKPPSAPPFAFGV